MGGEEFFDLDVLKVFHEMDLRWGHFINFSLVFFLWDFSHDTLSVCACYLWGSCVFVMLFV